MAAKPKFSLLELAPLAFTGGKGIFVGDGVTLTWRRTCPEQMQNRRQSKLKIDFKTVAFTKWS